MSKEYDFHEIEEKWVKKWEEKKLFHSFDVSKTTKENKDYLLFAFSYPSGSGLHTGHVESSTALDILARYKRMNGKDVFFPVGWDAFGLPAENYAIKTGVHPKETTKKAIASFSRQLKRIGVSYNWENELATSNPKYYKWTQWIFLQLFKRDMAYKKEAPVNWCNSCQTVLSNEQVVEGECERCGSVVEQKNMNQWFFKITDYAEELITGLESVDWPEPTKQQQIHWIGKSEGIDIEYPIKDLDSTITCFTTRPDTNFGATFIVVAPGSKFVKENFESFSDKESVSKYIEEANRKTELDRISDGKKKTGVFTGLYAINPLNSRELPIFVSDFVLETVGTGAVIGVPGHDVRDFEFAKEKGLDIIRVVVGDDKDESPITEKEQVQESNGIMINSQFLDGMDIMEAKEKIKDYIVKKGFGKRIINYRLRDWLISRQRYWGAPIPIVYDPSGKPHSVKEEHLPWVLPTDVDFLPTGESPLKRSKEFKERVERLYGKGWTPEYDTMDTFVDSSWYYLRYTDRNNEKVFASSESVEKLLPVDMYMIGAEHTVLHLLYSRFFTKFLRDSGYLDFDEPFMKMRHQGMILGPDGRKMSKSKGNVINPDDIVNEYGADSLRLYEMFMAPLEADKPWNTDSISGVYRFLRRFWVVMTNEEKTNANETTKEASALLNKTIKYVEKAILDLKFNTSISKFMELLNLVEKDGILLSRADAIKFLKIVAPFAPFITEELYSKLTDVSDGVRSIHLESWPVYNAGLITEDKVTIVVQVNGKLRGKLDNLPSDISDDELGKLASESVSSYLEGFNVVKTIVVKNKLINFVVKNSN